MYYEVTHFPCSHLKHQSRSKHIQDTNKLVSYGLKGVRALKHVNGDLRRYLKPTNDDLVKQTKPNISGEIGKLKMQFARPRGAQS